MSLDDHSADDASPKMAPRVILRHEIEDYGRFLGCTTLGNVLGGSFFVALIKYSHARPETES